MKRAVTIILELFFVFILIGTFSFGGGNAMYPLLLEELVKNHAWLTQRELIDLFAFAQMTPGPVATNAHMQGIKLQVYPVLLWLLLASACPQW